MDSEHIIYILTNEAMPGYIKIGKTSNLEQRVRDLSRSSGVPLPFQVFYAAKVKDMHKVEQLIHHGLGESRIASNREFFRIAPERVVSILKLAEIEKDVTPQVDYVDSVEEQQEINNARKRRSRFDFQHVDILPESVLTFTRNSEIYCKTTKESTTEVDFRGKIMSVSEAARLALGVNYQVNGTLFWEFEGETLDERRRKFEEGQG